MLTTDQLKAFNAVSERLKEIDITKKWTKIDDFMLHLEAIDDTQLINESGGIFEKHRLGTPHCRVDHPIENCLVPTMMNAVGGILDVWENGDDLDEQMRYVLKYFVTLTATGDIIS